MGVLVAATLVEHACGNSRWSASSGRGVRDVLHLPPRRPALAAPRHPALPAVGAARDGRHHRLGAPHDARRRDAGVHLRPHPRRRVARPAPPPSAPAAAAARAAPRARRRAALRPAVPPRARRAALVRLARLGAVVGALRAAVAARAAGHDHLPAGDLARRRAIFTPAPVVRRGAGLLARRAHGRLAPGRARGVGRLPVHVRRRAARRLRLRFVSRTLDATGGGALLRAFAPSRSSCC